MGRIAEASLDSYSLAANATAHRNAPWTAAQDAVLNDAWDTDPEPFRQLVVADAETVPRGTA